MWSRKCIQTAYPGQSRSHPLDAHLHQGGGGAGVPRGTCTGHWHTNTKALVFAATSRGGGGAHCDGGCRPPVALHRDRPLPGPDSPSLKLGPGLLGADAPRRRSTGSYYLSPQLVGPRRWRVPSPTYAPVAATAAWTGPFVLTSAGPC